jgi:AmmeMemoRadiSam system protein B/AmmeMemoRadiSam system protein A
MVRYGVSALLAVLVLAGGASLIASREQVKEPAVAGSFYPADPQELGRSVSEYLSRAGARRVQGRLIALVAPHAGYVYSGQVAAYAYRHITDRPVDTVILIGASHTAAYPGAAVYAAGSWRTPLGTVKINEKLAASLVNEKAGVTFFRDAFAREHSLEVQLPFLQTTLRDFTIVPVLLGAATQASFAHLAERLTKVLRENDRALIVVSTDLSHYHDAGAAATKDRKVIDAVMRMSVEDLQDLLARSDGEACGGNAVLLAMMVGRNLGATNGVLFRYADSGDASGDKARVVGYAAMGLYQTPLSEQQKRVLLALARRTIVDHVSGRTAPEPDQQDPRLLANGATFVTINRNHQLRGCIGNIQPVMPLYRSVIRNAVAASSQDPRFRPMTPEELKDMQIEVTILSPLEPVADAKNIVIGSHGVYLEKGGRSSVFLPQVPVEQGWDLPTTLEQLCIKAGLPANAWKDARLYRFSADIVR